MKGKNLIIILIVVLRLYLAVKNLFLSHDDMISSMMPQAGPSSGAAGNAVPPIDNNIGEVSQDEVWESVKDAEDRKERKLMTSKEWKEAERLLYKTEAMKESIGQRAKEIAQQKGFNPGLCEAFEDAAKLVAEDVDDMEDNQRIRFLVNLMKDLNNPESQSWARIEADAKKWRPWDF